MHSIKFSRNTLLSYIVVSQTFKLKLINANFLLPMISHNELSITLSTLWFDLLYRAVFAMPEVSLTSFTELPLQSCLRCLQRSQKNLEIF